MANSACGEPSRGTITVSNISRVLPWSAARGQLLTNRLAAPLAHLHPREDIIPAQPENVVAHDLGTQLTGEGGMAHDVDADLQQLRHFIRPVLVLLQQLIHGVGRSSFHRSSSRNMCHDHAVQPPSTESDWPVSSDAAAEVK